MNTIAKIRKLLEMTTANGCTEAEAANAAGMAQKLMNKHRISTSVLGEDEEEEIRAWEDPLDEMPNRLRQHWRGSLAMAVCLHNGCSVWWDTYRTKPRLNIVGRASDVSAARYLYKFVVREMDRLQATYRGNGRTWLNNWRLGVVDSVTGSLHKAKEDARREYTQETGTSLVVVDQALVAIHQRHEDAAAFARQKFNLRSSGAGGSGRRDDSARATGQRDGKGISVATSGKALGGGQRKLS